MNFKVSIFFVLAMSIVYSLQAQTSHTKWWNPEKSDFKVLEGQGWSNDLKNAYDRLPAKAEGNVPDPVWKLSKQSAGLMLRFRSNAKDIKVRYVVGGQHAMPHMPATGVSGVDMYAISPNGVMNWANGKYSFGDTITYHFANLDSVDKYHKLGTEYRLFLPLYNSVKWMEIGVDENAIFTPLVARKEKPIVVYGTSIAQGACASRPGMAWTSILGRKLDLPLINLGFSGNGRMEKEMVDLVGEIEASLFIIDCLPNLIAVADPKRYVTPEQIAERYIYAIKHLKAKYPLTPIVLAEHAGYTDEGTNTVRKKLYEDVNVVLRNVYKKMTQEGVKGLYIIPQARFNQDIETMVDGTHPSDLGMMQYAKGYEDVLRTILKQPIGKESTTHAVTQLRELASYDWEKRHEEILELAKTQKIKNVVIGNSITHFWGGRPQAHIARNQVAWNNTFGETESLNLGYGWDRIENALWRVYHGELDGYEAQNVLVHIGTNNLEWNSDEEIVAGWKMLIEAIKVRQPKADLWMMGIYPRRNQEKRILKLNLVLAQVARQAGVKYSDPGRAFLNAKGLIDENYFTDGLHPNQKGYEILGKEIKKFMK